LVHRCLELIARQGFDAWSTGRVVAAAAAYRQWLLSQGHAADDAASGAAEVVAAVCCTLDSDTGRWLLADHEE
jgi:hypothetical protein